jgi:predicted NAD/FAD-dependent oxidoreductase
MFADPIAIVGAGLAGLACAKSLAARGQPIRVYDKGRGPGGRLATRRVEVEGRSFSFDHGAQYLTARGELFGATLDAVGAKGWSEPGWRVGVPRMSSIPRALADGLEVSLSRHVVEIVGEPGAWRIRHLDAALVRPGRPLPDQAPEEDGPFAAVAVAVPAPQAIPLLEGRPPALAGVIADVRLAPCWTLMAAFDTQLSLPNMLRPPAGAIAWAARDSSKPGRDHAQEAWVIQAGPDWSREHLELTPKDAAALLLAEFGKLAPLPEPIYAAAHRWRYSLVEVPLGAPCVWNPELRLGTCGDWCIAGRAEAAAESGAALATAMQAG